VEVEEGKREGNGQGEKGEVPIRRTVLEVKLSRYWDVMRGVEIASAILVWRCSLNGRSSVEGFED